MICKKLKCLGRWVINLLLGLIMKYPMNTVEIDGEKTTFVWMNGVEFDKYSPVTQSYGIIINPEKEILTYKREEDKWWSIPGGTPESGETCEKALVRELMEEVDVEAKRFERLGVQKAYVKGKELEAIYQVRFVVYEYKLHPQTPDPDNGLIYKRKFVPASKINEYVTWGLSGRAMFEDALNLFNSLKL